MDLLNDMVNNKEKLLQDLRNFRDKLYEKDNRVINKLVGWEVISKPLNKTEFNMKKSINDNIVSSDDIINSIIISKIDKDNELYRIIMNKNRIITLSINMLNSSENYNKITENKLNNNNTEINLINEKIRDKMSSSNVQKKYLLCVFRTTF